MRVQYSRHLKSSSYLSFTLHNADSIIPTKLFYWFSYDASGGELRTSIRFFAELSSIIMIDKNYPEKICTLWNVFLLVTLFHTQLGLMPLFHDLSVVQSHADRVESINWVLWLMLAFFVIPMLVIILTVFTHSTRYRKLHLGITIIYSVLNIAHLAADLMVQLIFWYQIALMAILVGVGLLLNWVAYQWSRGRKTLHALN